ISMLNCSWIQPCIWVGLASGPGPSRLADRQMGFGAGKFWLAGVIGRASTGQGFPSFLEEPLLQFWKLRVVRPTIRVLHPHIAVAAEVETQPPYLWKRRVDAVLVPGEKEVAEQLIKRLSRNFARLGGLEVHQGVAGDQVRIRPAHQMRRFIEDWI